MKAKKQQEFTEKRHYGVMKRILLAMLIFSFAVCSSQTMESAYARTDAYKLQTAVMRMSGVDKNTSANNVTLVKTSKSSKSSSTVNPDKVPKYSGKPYVVINKNVPKFSKSDKKASSFERYGKMDYLGRCSTAYACIGSNLMPTKERGSIGQVKPTGWHTVKYDFVNGKYLYNRCHLIGYQLTAENANRKNLITGTRYLNVEGMLPFENMVADYIEETDNHVLYRVTPIFKGKNLVASGVQIEAESVEDKGDGIQFNVYCYNVQPGVSIDYKTGNSSANGKSSNKSSGSSNSSSSKKSSSKSSKGSSKDSEDEHGYILNTSAHKFHNPGCYTVRRMSDRNKKYFTGTRDEVMDMGYDPCGVCHP